MKYDRDKSLWRFKRLKDHMTSWNINNPYFTTDKVWEGLYEEDKQFIEVTIKFMDKAMSDWWLTKLDAERANRIWKGIMMVRAIKG